MSARGSAPPGITILVVALLIVTTIASTAPALADEKEIRIQQDHFDTHRGAVVELPMSVPSGENVTIRFARTTMAITTRSVVADGGDGSIIVVLNTYNGRWSVRNDTDRVVSQERNPDRAVRAATYELSVRTDDDWARATVEVSSESLDRITTWRARNRNAPFRDARAISTAIGAGDIERAETVRRNDTLVIQLDAPGLSGALAAMPGENTTKQFRHLFATLGSFSVLETNPPPERQPAHIRALNSSAFHVFPDHTTGTYYITIDLSKAQVMRGDDPVEEFGFEDAELGVRARLTANTNLSDGEERVDAFVASRRARIVRSPDEPLRLASTTGQHIEGKTNVGTGLNVSVVVRIADNPSTTQNETTVRRTKATVTKSTDYNENAFDAVLNLSGIPEGTDGRVFVTFENETLLDSPAPARIPPATTTTSPPSTTQTTPTPSLPSTITATNATTTATSMEFDQSSNHTGGTVPALGVPGTLLVLVASLGFFAFSGQG